MNAEPVTMTGLRTGVPMELERLACKAMAKNPGERYQHMDEMLVDLRAVRVSSDRGALGPPASSKKRGRRVVQAVGATAVIVFLVGMVWLLFVRKSTVEGNRKSIAVLPFNSITKTEEDKSFAEGIQDDILTQLAKIRDLKVIARTSVIRYKDSQKSIKEIARELGVAVVLEGSTRRWADSVRVTAQLIDGESEEHVWAEKYDRPYTGIFAIQSDVAQKIASALRAALTPEEQSSIQAQPTKNLLAYEYYQKGMYFWRTSRDLEGNRKAAEMFEKAVSLDSSFGLAYARLANVYAALVSIPPGFAEYGPKCEAALDQAVRLQTGSSLLHLVRGSYIDFVKKDPKAALVEYEAARAQSPNDVEVLEALAAIRQRSLHDYVGALAIAEKIFDLDPKGNSGPYWGGFSALSLRRFSEAERWGDIMIANAPEDGIGYSLKIETTLYGFGDTRKTQALLDEAKRLVTRNSVYNALFFEWRTAFYARAYVRALAVLDSVRQDNSELLHAFTLERMNRLHQAQLYYDSARSIFENIVAREPQNRRSHLRLALAYAGLRDIPRAILQVSYVDTLVGSLEPNAAIVYTMIGDTGKAFLNIERSLQWPEPCTGAILRLDPRFDPIRSDPRFQKLVAAAK